MKKSSSIKTLQASISNELQKRYTNGFLNIKELAQELNCSTFLIQNFIKNGSLTTEYHTIGNSKNVYMVVPVAAVASFLSQAIAA